MISSRDVDDGADLHLALEHANLPSLVPALFQLTGQPRWLTEPYRPTRSRGMDDNDCGGFSTEIAAEIRHAVLTAVLAYEAGTPLAVPTPTGPLLQDLLSLANGEPAPGEYVDMLAEDLGFTPVEIRQAPPATDIDAVIIGAGVSGMLAAIKLREAGIEHVVLEKNAEVGGGWYENTYPGAGVDTPSHLYSFSFAPRNWSTHFAKRDEVEQYLSEVADTYDLDEVIRFGVDVVAAAYDEATGRWTTRTATGQEFTSQILISAVGALNRPRIPAIPGLDDFRGQIFHTAQWPQSVNLRNKRVAVVGAGASAMQVVPAIADSVARLSIFQRSPQWIAPNDSYFSEIDPAVALLMDRVPCYRNWYRARLAWNYNDRVHPALQIDPDWEHPERSVNAVNDGHRRVFTRYLESELNGRPDLIGKSLPDYPPFGKRMLLDNGWFHTLRREHVDLVTEGVAEITPSGVRGTNGTEVEVDVIIMATGFHTHRYLWPMEITGRSGATLAEVWGRNDAHAYLGITVPDFPNLFITCGPGTALGHGGSFITVAECQVRYILDMIVTMAERDLRSVTVRPEVEAEYRRRHDEAHARMLWTHPGMTNWYRNADGRIVSTMPWRVVDYWQMTHRSELADYQVVKRAATGARAPG